MADVLAPVARQLFLNPSTGAPYAGAKIFTYAGGTTTKLATFTDSTGGTANANPIILDSLGECDIWIPVSTAYKFVFSPPTDTDPPTNAIWTRDQIQTLSTQIVPTLAVGGASIGSNALAVNGTTHFHGAVSNDSGGFTETSALGFAQSSFGVITNYVSTAISIASSSPITFSVIPRTNGVQLNDGASAWSAISDETLKTPFAPFLTPLAKVKTLKAGTGRYLTDGPQISRSFLSAQSVQAVLPEAVAIYTNPADADDPKNGKLMLSYTDVIPLLVAAVQQLTAEVQSLREAAGLA